MVDDGDAMLDDPAIVEAVAGFARSLVALSVVHRLGPRAIPGVAVADGIVGAYEIVCKAPTVHDLMNVGVFKDGRRSSGQVSNERAAWQTCAVDVDDALRLPPARVRWSTTLRLDEPLLAVVCDPEAGDDTLGTDKGWLVTCGRVIELFPPDQALDPWEQSLYAAALFPSPPPLGSVVCDLQGRLAGCIEYAPKVVDNSRIVIPGEWMSGYGSSHAVSCLLKLAEVASDARERALGLFLERRETSEDPRLFCAVAEAYIALGRREEARDALSRALELQPDNRWAEAQRASL